MHKNNNKKVYTKEKDSNYDDNLYVTPNIGINFIYQTWSYQLENKSLYSLEALRVTSHEVSKILSIFFKMSGLNFLHDQYLNKYY